MSTDLLAFAPAAAAPPVAQRRSRDATTSNGGAAFGREFRRVTSKTAGTTSDKAGQAASTTTSTSDDSPDTDAASADESFNPPAEVAVLVALTAQGLQVAPTAVDDSAAAAATGQVAPAGTAHAHSATPTTDAPSESALDSATVASTAHDPTSTASSATTPPAPAEAALTIAAAVASSETHDVEPDAVNTGRTPRAGTAGSTTRTAAPNPTQPSAMTAELVAGSRGPETTPASAANTSASTEGHPRSGEDPADTADPPPTGAHTAPMTTGSPSDGQSALEPGFAALTRASTPPVATDGSTRAPDPLAEVATRVIAEARLAELETALAQHGPNGTKILGASRLLRGGPGAPSTLTINLDPAALGKIRVELSLHEGQVALSLHADKAQAVQALNAQMPQLRDTLEADGVRLAHLGVDLSQQGSPHHGGGQATSSSDHTSTARSTDSATDSLTDTDQHTDTAPPTTRRQRPGGSASVEVDL